MTSKKDGDEIGKDCPVCGKPMHFFMGFQDCFSHKTGHYTTDRPMAICQDPDCDYAEDYEDPDNSYDDNYGDEQ